MIHWQYFTIKEKALAICSSLAIIAAILAFYFFGPSIDSSCFYFFIAKYDRIAKLGVRVFFNHYWLILVAFIIAGIGLITSFLS